MNNDRDMTDDTTVSTVAGLCIPPRPPTTALVPAPTNTPATPPKTVGMLVEFFRSHAGKRGFESDSDSDNPDAGDEKKDDEDALSATSTPMPKKKRLALVPGQSEPREPIDKNGVLDPLMWGVDCVWNGEDESITMQPDDNQQDNDKPAAVDNEL